MRRLNLVATILCTFLFVSQLLAQKGEKVPGYILKEDGERIEGRIEIGSITDNEVKVSFYHPGKSKKTVYKPNALAGYGYEATEVDEIGQETTRWIHFEKHKVDYPPKPFGPTTVFMEKEEEGELTLFCYYIEVRNNPKQPYRYDYYIKNHEGKLTKVTRESFEGDIRGLVKDYGALYSRVGQKKFEYRNLDRMVRDYNYWTVNKHDSSEYRVAMKDN